MEHLYLQLQEPFHAYLQTLSEGMRHRHLSELLAGTTKCKCSACGLSGHIKTNRLCPAKHVGSSSSSSSSSIPMPSSSASSSQIPLPTSPSMTSPSGPGGGNFSHLPIPMPSAVFAKYIRLPKPNIKPLPGRVYPERVEQADIQNRNMVADTELLGRLEQLDPDIETMYPELLVLARNDSWMDMMDREPLYLAFCTYLQYAALVFPHIFEQDTRALLTALSKQHEQALFYVTRNDVTGILHTAIIQLFTALTATIITTPIPITSTTTTSSGTTLSTTSTTTTSSGTTLSTTSTTTTSSGTTLPPPTYMTTMTAMAFREAELDLARHTFHGSLSSRQGRTQLTRVAKEFATLSTTLPISETTSVIVRLSHVRTDFLSFMVTGPMGTPYAYGCFIFDMYLPWDYPRSPPKCWLRTTGNGTVRFNPNLYAEGKVCLSLLGTWTGPGWSEQHSTILQVINSIQALILVEEPYFNEPGRQYGKPNPSSRTYNQEVKVNTMRHAILAHLRCIQTTTTTYESIFDAPILAHLTAHKDRIIEHAIPLNLDPEDMLLLTSL